MRLSRVNRLSTMLDTMLSLIVLLRWVTTVVHFPVLHPCAQRSITTMVRMVSLPCQHSITYYHGGITLISMLVSVIIIVVSRHFWAWSGWYHDHRQGGTTALFNHAPPSLFVFVQSWSTNTGRRHLSHRHEKWHHDVVTTRSVGTTMLSPRGVLAPHG